jgi:polyisoprenoid-binding protein YceI
MSNHRELAYGLLRVTFGVIFLFFGIAFLSASSILTMSGQVSNENVKAASSKAPATIRFRLDSSQSKFIAHGLRGGLFWFKGHEHLIAARDFTGEVLLTLDTITPASLQLTVQAGSMGETSAVFTEQQKQIINKELREIVFEPEKYPEIVFKSSDVTGKSISSNQYEVKIGGDLTLHGVTRHTVIPAKVTLSGNELRAVGEFSIDRSDFKVRATSAFHGLVQVRDKVKFTFDLIGHRI